jgi:hypothetical protein
MLALWGLPLVFPLKLCRHAELYRQLPVLARHSCNRSVVNQCLVAVALLLVLESSGFVALLSMPYCY